jgi:hypothetical protein
VGTGILKIESSSFPVTTFWTTSLTDNDAPLSPVWVEYSTYQYVSHEGEIWSVSDSEGTSSICIYKHKVDPVFWPIKHYSMKKYGEVDVYIHEFLTSALAGGQWSASRPGCLTPEERDLSTFWLCGLVGPWTGLNNVKKRKVLPLPELELK